MRFYRYGRVINPQWTDLAVVLGPNVRWVEFDTNDLLEERPEVLLGHRVLMCTPNDLYRVIQGRRVEKVVLLDIPSDLWDHKWTRARDEVSRALYFGHIGRLEEWHVHRGEGIWKIGGPYYLIPHT